MVNRTFKLLVIANQLGWPSLQAKVDAIRAFYAPVCNLDITIQRVSLNPVYALYPDLAPLNVIDRGYYDLNIASPNALAADIILFITEAPQTVITPNGYMSMNNVGPWEATVFARGENDHTYMKGTDMGDTFTLFACHELSHAFYRLVGKPDLTHTYFPAPDTPYVGPPSAVLKDFDFSSRISTLNWLLDQLKAMATALSLLKKQNVATVCCVAPSQPSQEAPSATQAPQPRQSTPSAPIVAPASNPDALQSPWSDPVIAHHNVRALCDIMGLTGTELINGTHWLKKDIVTACVYQESQFKIGAVHQNYKFNPDGTRVLESTDYGIVQINDYWHIGPGKDFSSVQYVLDNPEADVRYMIQYYLDHENLKAWCSYSTGAFKQHLGKV
jgi:hypothetical protein